jgi:hypothetical protein
VKYIHAYSFSSCILIPWLEYWTPISVWFIFVGFLLSRKSFGFEVLTPDVVVKIRKSRAEMLRTVSLVRLVAVGCLYKNCPFPNLYLFDTDYHTLFLFENIWT